MEIREILVRVRRGESDRAISRDLKDCIGNNKGVE